MDPLVLYLVCTSLFIWAGILIVPWQPWRVKESWDSESSGRDHDLSDVTVLIPARNESKVIQRTLKAVAFQGKGLRIILLDDRSDDDTAGKAKESGVEGLTVVDGKKLPAGWSGKLWALEQARLHADTALIMLMDADIELDTGVIPGLKHKLINENKDFISLMAAPPLNGFWEKLLMPAFVYFFKLLYPFKLANSDSKFIAAAAGGCILMKREVIGEIGGFAAVKDALIDDCSLARKVKNSGFKIWLGLTHSVNSIRPYKSLGEIWNMVARTAYSQLFNSIWILLLCTFILILAFIVPPVLIFNQDQTIFYLALVAMSFMFISYQPVLLYYERTPYWALLMPVIGILYLLMTWTSAVRFWKGERMRWRGRIITRNAES